MGNSSLLDTTCTAAIIARYILQCIMGNYTNVTRNTASRQFDKIYKSKSSSKHSHFPRHGAYCLSCNSPKYLFVLLNWTAFRPALFWPDTVANQGSICWFMVHGSFKSLRAPFDLPTAANIHFFECCMSAYRTPDLNDVL